jgi:hypothetical protein
MSGQSWYHCFGIDDLVTLTSIGNTLYCPLNQSMIYDTSWNQICNECRIGEYDARMYVGHRNNGMVIYCLSFASFGTVAIDDYGMRNWRYDMCQYDNEKRIDNIDNCGTKP